MAANTPAPQPFSIPVSGVGAQAGAKLRVPQHFRFANDIPTVGSQFADGVATIELPVGQYTYRMIKLNVSSTIVVVGKSFAMGLRNYINTANLSDYISKVALEIDGKIAQEFFISELVDWNKLMNYDAQNGVLTLAFGSPGVFKDEVAEDAYLLGTADLRSVRVLVTLTSAWVATLKLNCNVEYAKVARPVGYLVTMQRSRYTAPGSGDFIITDLPHGIDMAAIWFRSTNAIFAGSIQLDVDTETVFEASALELKSLNQIWGKDIAQLPAADIYLDFWRELDAGKGLASLSAIAQVRRDAKLKATLTFDAAGASFYAITFHCGPYKAQR